MPAFSDDARVMVRPFGAYAELAAARDDDPVGLLVQRIGLFLVTIAGFVSLISAGRLVAFHFASTMIAWSFAPAWQAAAFALSFRVFARGHTQRSLVSALGLYFTGHGPWLLFLLSIAAVCLLVPDPAAVMGWALSSRFLMMAFLGTIVWSGVLTTACFRAGLGLSRGRAAGATALFYLAFSAAIIGYYLAMNEIQPQAPWAQ